MEEYNIKELERLKEIYLNGEMSENDKKLKMRYSYKFLFKLIPDVIKYHGDVYICNIFFNEILGVFNCGYFKVDSNSDKQSLSSFFDDIVASNEKLIVCIINMIICLNEHGYYNDDLFFESIEDELPF